MEIVIVLPIIVLFLGLFFFWYTEGKPAHHWITLHKLGDWMILVGLWFTVIYFTGRTLHGHL